MDVTAVITYPSIESADMENEDGCMVKESSLSIEGLSYEISASESGEVTVGCKTHKPQWWKRFGMGYGIGQGLEEDQVEEMRIAFEVLLKQRSKMKAATDKVLTAVRECEKALKAIAKETQEQINEQIDAFHKERDEAEEAVA